MAPGHKPAMNAPSGGDAAGRGRITRPAAQTAIGSAACTDSVQAFRVGSAVYATQFHPELDAASLCTRIEVYKHAGYFEPAQADELKAQAHRSNVTHPPAILSRFARRYATPATTSAAPRRPATVT